MNRPTARRRWLRPIGVIVVSLAIAFAWHAYQTADAWHVGIPRHFWQFGTPLLPLYADASPVDLASHARLRGLAFAVVASLGSLAAIVAAVTTRRATWLCLLVAVASTFAMNVAVGHLRHDHAGFVEPFTRGGLEYHPDVRLVRDDPLKFIADYPTLSKRGELGHHPGTHPPGGVLFLWAGEKLFGPAPEPPRPPPPTTRDAVLRLFRRPPVVSPVDRTLESAVWLAVGFTALGGLPAFWLARLAGGAASARRVLPLYVVTPNLVLFGATSMDGVFLVFCLAALASGVAAIRRRSFAWPLVAGVALWLATFMTFAAVAVPTFLACLTIVDATRRPRAALGLILRCAAVGVVFVLCQLAAQRWLHYDFRATADAAMRTDYNGLGVTGYESIRLWACLAFANALAFALGSGVVTIALVAIALLAGVWRWRPATRFGVAFVATIALLATSTLFTLETERVWLFLTPLALITATAAFRGRVVWALALAGLLAQTIFTEVFFRTWW